MAAVLLNSAAPSFVRAQSILPDLGFPMGSEAEPTRILVLDQDRLFAESKFGKRVAAEIDARSRVIAAENRQLESQLEQEERDLTALRPTLEPAAFREKANTFNDRVQRIRLEQDNKARALVAFRESEQQRFFASLRPVLFDLAEENSAVAILDRRLLLLAAESIDITGPAILRVDEVIGDGALREDGDHPDAQPKDAAPDASGAPPGTGGAAPGSSGGAAQGTGAEGADKPAPTDSGTEGGSAAPK